MQTKSKKKEDQIFAAVLAISAEKGLSGLKMTAVAQVAGMGYGNIYVYHNSKVDLINNSYQRAKKAANNAILNSSGVTSSKSITDTDMLGFREATLKLWRQYLAYLIHHQQEIRFMQQCLESDFLNESSKSLADEFGHFIFSFFSAGIAAGYVKSVDVSLILTVFKGVAGGIVELVETEQLAVGKSIYTDSFDLCWDAIRNNQ